MLETAETSMANRSHRSQSIDPGDAVFTEDNIKRVNKYFRKK